MLSGARFDNQLNQIYLQIKQKEIYIINALTVSFVRCLTIFYSSVEKLSATRKEMLQ